MKLPGFLIKRVLIGLFVVVAVGAAVYGYVSDEKESSSDGEDTTVQKGVEDLEKEDERVLNYVEGVPLQDIAEMNKVVLFEFRAEWCPYCKEFEKDLPEYVKEREDLTAVKIDIDEHRGLSEEFGVTGTPTLLLMYEGEAVSRTSGAVPKPKMDEWIKDVTGKDIKE